MLPDINVEILKSLWTRGPDGQWAINALKGISLKPKPGFDLSFFSFKSELELMTNTPPANLGDMFTSFGSTDFLIKQSILPVVAWIEGADFIRCIGTAFLVSCSGYVVTASHVLLDPKDCDYGSVTMRGQTIEYGSDLIMGVLQPINPASGQDGFQLIPFEAAWYWGEWRETPLFNEEPRLHSLTDIALCKLPEKTHGGAYQPLTLSINPFVSRELAYAIGYARMENIPVRYLPNGQTKIEKFPWELFVSIGEVTEIFPSNHLEKVTPTPGPCFNFHARIPGKMSGSPIFGAQGAVIRGVVSRSFSGEHDASGCMIGPVMSLPLGEGQSLKALMDAGTEGIVEIQGQGL